MQPYWFYTFLSGFYLEYLQLTVIVVELEASELFESPSKSYVIV